MIGRLYLGLLFISCWGTFAQPRPYVALRMGVNQARHQFDPKLIQANPNPAGNPAHFDRIGSGQAKNIQITSELALGLSVPVSSGVITDLEVTYDPRKYDSRKTLNFIGFFDNPPAAGRYDYSQAY
ncbi:MAG: hypothetical protein C0582_00460 [Alphaproteobacteria bacterium]|nr:MAG: hypothetical protein C0582_00460 [Alphaproteobacteria bacterium]